jgi:hypothetical protein
MLRLIEGARNSGKTYLLQWANIEPYKFPFPFWYGKLKLSNNDVGTHHFAVGKEIMLHHLNRDGHIRKELFIDRGILTVLVWGVLENRITMDEAVKQLWTFANEGLFDETEVIYIKGENPRERGAKDVWDNSDKAKEALLYEELLTELHEALPNLKITRFQNGFDMMSAVEFRESVIKGLDL